MPLPPEWMGFFWDESNGGNDILSLTSEKFLDEYSFDLDAKYICAKVCFDLYLHNNVLQYKKFLDFGKQKWKKAPWELISTFVDYANKLLLTQVDYEKVKGIIDYNMNVIFGNIDDVVLDDV